MKITKIQQQAQRKDRYSVYVDGKYLFSLSDYQLVKAGIKLGTEYTQEKLDKLIEESNFGKAYERTLRYVMLRPRSEKEVEEYLKRTFLYPPPRSFIDKQGNRQVRQRQVDKEVVTNMIDRVLRRLQDKGYVNDELFAVAWIRSRQLTKPSSKRRLKQELKAKGVGDDIIAAALVSQSDNEISNLKIVIAKKRKLSRYQDSKRLTQYLLRQGFRYSDIVEHL